MAENLKHLVDLGGLQQLAVQTKNRISATDTYNIKYVNTENNVLKFYRDYDAENGVTGVEPAFTIDFPSSDRMMRAIYLTSTQMIFLHS